MMASWLRNVAALCSVLIACAEDPVPDAPTSDVIIYRGEGPYERVPERDFIAAWGRAHTALLENCCEYFGRSVAEAASGPPAPRAESGAIYDEAAGSACIAQLMARSCPHGKDGPTVPDACSDAFHDGQLGTNEICTSGWECRQTTETPQSCSARAEGDAIVRRCRTRGAPVPDAGEPCLPEEDGRPSCRPPLQCRPDLRCDLPQLGEPCLSGAPWGDTCAKGLVCDALDTKRCIEPLSPGSACNSWQQCELFLCVDGACAEPMFGVHACTIERTR